MKEVLMIMIGGLLGASLVYFIGEEKAVIDNTQYFKEQRDSLEHINDIFLRTIKKRDLELDASKERSDSLLAYQNKIYLYYDKELKRLDSLNDSQQLELFNLLTNF